MGKFCCVFNCGKRSERDKNISFHIVPVIISQGGTGGREPGRIGGGRGTGGGRGKGGKREF